MLLALVAQKKIL